MEGNRPTRSVTRWYGWQTLIGVIGGDLVSLVGQGSVVTYFGIAGHVLSGPIVHWTHGHVGKGFISLGLNVGAPLVLGAIGLAAGGTSGDVYGSIAGGFIGFGLGYIAAPIIDIAALSTETVEEEAKDKSALLPSSVMVVPMVGQNRVGLSVVGQF